MGTYPDTVPFLADMPPIELISAWEPYGGGWQFRLLAVGTVDHVLGVREGRIFIVSEVDWKWQPLTLLDTVPVEHRPVRGNIPMRWARFFALIGRKCPEYLRDRRENTDPDTRYQPRYDLPRIPRLTRGKG